MVASTDEAGNLRGRARYTPTGQLRDEVGYVGPFGFTGPTYNVKNDAHAEPKKLGNHAPLSEEKLEN